MTTKTAVLIDGGFFVKRYQYLCGSKPPDQVATEMHKMACAHAKRHDGELYRIYYYDCRPFDGKLYHPISKRNVDYSATPIHQFRTELFHHLCSKRKVALRLGYLSTYKKWKVAPRSNEKLLKQKITVGDLAEADVTPDLTQKGVDIKIGIDIATLALKRLVQRIVLVSGDGDFVPAAKLARIEGIDFILDPMWANINDSLNEHIDGIHSIIKPPKS